ncbi:MAG: glutamine synthetase family protein [Cyanobacteria bacterium P01_D01_bin.156]
MSTVPPSSEAISTWVTDLQEQGVKYVRFELPDLHGVSRLKVIPINKVAGYASKGLNFYGGTLALDTASSVVPGSGYHEERKYRDMVLFPDIESCTPVPWVDNTVKVVCDAYWDSKTLIKGAPRYALQSLLDLAQQMGFEVMMGHEFEFYLLDADTHKPLFDGLHIFNHIRNQYVPEINQLLDYLQAAGIDVITHNCEYAPSQFEINFGPGMGIKGADKAFTFKNAVKEIAHHLGYQASFMSKPFAGMAGCCCHFHISLWNNDGTNAFLDTSDENGLSSIAKSFTQGILAHAPAMLPLIGPTPNCYRRLKPHTFAPSNISWGIEDRTAMVRVKATGDEQTHLEMRAASGLSNPYLSAAATLAAGVLGIKENLSLQPMADGPSEEDASLQPFPKTLDAALEALAADSAMQELLGPEFCQLFSTVKAFELDRFHDHITDWEVEEYLEIY